MTAPITPSRGIRLASGAPIPPAPIWGIDRPVTFQGRHAGGVVEITPTRHVPVCVHSTCFRALPACDTYRLGKVALREHWMQEHPGTAS